MKIKKSKTKKISNSKNLKLVTKYIIYIVTISFWLALIIMIFIKSTNQRNLVENINKNYNHFVVTNKDSYLYKLNNDEYIKVGKINTNEELTLEEIDIIHEAEYFKITTFEEEYYIHYKDVDKITELTENNNNQRYKKYILFNKNIVTKDITNFYDEENNLIYTFNKSFDLPIIINKNNIYGIEYNNKLLYIKKEDVKEIKNNQNTKLKNTSGIAVLNYHFFYYDDKESERKDCNQSICISTTNFKKHLKYIKDNNIFTPTMKELEMYIDGYLQLPKSVSITIDDGWRASIGTDILTQEKINATVFLMSKAYGPTKFASEYVETHSHGHDLHNPGICPGGQGGAIKCLEKSKLLEDLKLSREKLNGTTVFCYPFYEYNQYSINVLKEAGFTMAFAGKKESTKKVVPGINKYRLPRYVIVQNTSVENIKQFIG